MSYETPFKTGKLLIEPSHVKGSYDSHGVDSPFLFKDGERYGMTFVAWDGTGYQTGLAFSDDLLHWEKYGVILGRGPAGSVTQYNAAMTSILRDNDLHGSGELKKVNGRYVGTWHAYPNAGYESGPAVIGIAYSDDLLHWEIDEALALTPDPACDWEAGGLYKSWLLEHEGTYYLFYNAKNTATYWIEQTGFATSTDLKTWTRSPLNPVLKIGEAGSFEDRFASDPCILRDGSTWVMFYFGNSTDGHARDSYATSADLQHWTKSGEILIDVGTAGSIDSQYAHKPGIITKGGELYHFYCAVEAAPHKKIGSVEVNEIRGITLARSAR